MKSCIGQKIQRVLQQVFLISEVARIFNFGTMSMFLIQDNYLKMEAP